ncbi:MAG TPA: GNAT family N-acetyltransferase [Ruminococcaceae bacterium]|nr:GNAT family N-acetyltransferase [Oscillospiraceae bacterium]
MEIKRVSSPEEFELAFDIRLKVFVEEQHVPLSEELDDYDKEALHILVLTDGLPVGCGRVYLRDDTAKLGRIAVLKEYRGSGAGFRLCEELISAAIEMGAKTLILDAQTQAVGFYKKLGFKEEGEIFLDAGIDHIRMRREI